MTIQRQYSLPNCKLVLEGLGDDAATPGTSRPLLSVLMNAECHFIGHPSPLTGGREFLEHLITAVSHYAQECLSGVPHPDTHRARHGVVGLQKLDHNRHRLTVYPKSDQADNAAPAGEPQQIELQTLQFFDLVEAIDQLLADPQTLPDLSLNLVPVSRRYANTQEPLAKRAAPAAIGISGLAAAAIALFFVPVPEVRPPQPRPSNSQESPANSDSSSSDPRTTTPVAAVSPEDSTSEDTETTRDTETTEDTEATEDTDEATTADAASSDESSPAVNTARSNASADDASDTLEQLADSAPVINDLDTLEKLTDDLRKTISQAWDRDEIDFSDDLVYRVGVAENGDILGFKQTDQASIDYTDETPLLSLLYNPVESQSRQDEPMAEFKVVFRPNGVVEVSPWYGWPEP